MEEIIQKILDELYGIDPSLKAHEEKIIKIITEYRQARPETKFDEAFANQLKKEILARIKEMAAKPEEKEAGSIFGLLLAKRFTTALVGAAVVMLVAVVSLASYLNFNNLGRISGGQKLNLNFAQGISRVADGAFGQLSNLNRENLAATEADTSGGVNQNASAKTSSSVSRSEAAPLAIGRGGGGGVAADSAKMIMPPYEVTNFVYKYVGEEINQTEAQLAVFKRLKSGVVGRI